MSKTLLAALVLLALPAVAAPGATDDLFEFGNVHGTCHGVNLAGSWRVTGVAPASTGKGEAVVRNDPAYMGHMLQVSDKLLAWAKPPGGNADRCAGPAPQHLTGAEAAKRTQANRAALTALGITSARAVGNPHEVVCDTGSWGPAPAGGAFIFPVDRDHFAMTWYDGAVLKLTRAAR